jgi:hypothetical protein
VGGSQVLIAAATVSLIIGLIEDPHEGYIEGTAIVIAGGPHVHARLLARITSMPDVWSRVCVRVVCVCGARLCASAVLLVATVTATNNYNKERQFRSLEATSKKDERVFIKRGECHALPSP